MKIMLTKYKSFYDNFTKGLRCKKTAVKIISILDKALAYSFAIAYPLFLALALFGKPFQLLYALNIVGIPALCFCAVTLLRILIKRPRPYETRGAGINPLVKKRGEGNSMPSRHVASAFVISMVILSECLWAGIACLVVAFALAVLRFLEGVHYPSDLLAGGALGIAFGLISLLF